MRLLRWIWRCRAFRLLRYPIALLALLYLGEWIGPRVFGGPSLIDGLCSSTVVRAKKGGLLRLALASDGVYRLVTPLEKISPELVAAFLLYEDRAFFRHPGVNPLSLLRAIYATYLDPSGRRIGASTITMQLARRMHRIQSNRVAGKLFQIGRALLLELRYRKRAIIEAYLNRVPMGANIEGVGAAAMIYFGKPAAELTLAEAITLAVIPQNPAARGPRGGHASRELRAARNRLLAIWKAERETTDVDLARARLLPRLRGRSDLPFIAPHFTRDLLVRRVGPATDFRTTLDLGLQRLVERQVQLYLERVRELGIRNAAVLLLDHRDMGVVALMGSAGFHDAAIDGQVDGTMAYRSPGSTLKPFVYALALDQGLITPESLLRDVPTRFGNRQPENFDRGFSGPIAAWSALVRSRNVPAYALAARLRQDDDLYVLLSRASIARLRTRDDHGLGLALGTVELSMRELARLYGALATDGVVRPLRYRATAQRAPGARLMSPQAAFVVRQMLARNRRPGSLTFTGRQDVTSWAGLPYKTGTSNGYRDAWSAGIVGPYVLVVWLGDFSGRPNPSLVGMKAAAPLFFSIADALAIERPRLLQYRDRRPDGVEQVEVCALSGALPHSFCPHRKKTWFIPGRSPIALCAVHKEVWLDEQGRRVCDLDQSGRQKHVIEDWPSDLLDLFRRAGVPRGRPPAPAASCLAARADDGGPSPSTGLSDSAPAITSPRSGSVYLTGTSGRARLPLLASTTDGARVLHWFVDQRYIGPGQASEPLLVEVQAGHHVVRAIDGHGRVASRELTVRMR